MPIKLNPYDNSKSDEVKTSFDGITIASGETSKSVFSDSNPQSGTILGIDSSSDAKYGILNGSASYSVDLAKIKKDEDGKLDEITLAEAEAEVKGSLYEGTISASVGCYSAESSVTVGEGTLSGTIGATLYKDGKLSPQLEAEIKGEVRGITVDGTSTLGDDNLGTETAASMTLGVASASVGAGAGKITWKDESGKEQSGYGVKAEAKAEAYLIEGTLSQSVNVSGAKATVGVTAKAGGGGVSVGGKITSGYLEGEIGIGLGLGISIKFSIDVSGFKWPWEKTETKKSSSSSSSGSFDLTKVFENAILSMQLANLKLKVSPDDLKAQSAKIEQEINTMEREWNKVVSTINSSGSYWEGAGGLMNRMIIKNMESEMQTVLTELRGQQKKLLDMAKIYEEAENTAVEKANSLSSDVIS